MRDDAGGDAGGQRGGSGGGGGEVIDLMEDEEENPFQVRRSVPHAIDVPELTDYTHYGDSGTAAIEQYQNLGDSKVPRGTHSGPILKGKCS